MHPMWSSHYTANGTAFVDPIDKFTFVAYGTATK